MGHIINKKITILISTLIAVLVLVVGVTFAYFAAQSSTTAQTITSGTLSISFTSTNVLRTQNILPITEDQVDSKATELNFSVKNTGNITGYFDISLTDIVMNKELRNSDFKWRLIEGNSVKNEGDFQIASTKKILIHNISIEPDTTKTYKLLVWLNETNKPQNEMQGKSLSAKVTVNSNDRVNGFALSESPVLENTVENGVISNLRMYGNSVQNGTPTPDNPVEIQSVGDKTKNLAIAKDIYKNTNNYTEMKEDDRNTIRFVDNTTVTYNDINFKPNTRYTVSFEAKSIVKPNITQTNTSPYNLFCFFYTDGTKSVLNSLNVDVWNKYILTSTKGKTVEAIGIMSTNFIYYNFIDIDTFQLEEGDTATDYEPYGYYKIPVTVSNENSSNIANIYLDEPLRAIGNYKDYIDFESGKIVRKVFEYKITGNENWSIYDTKTGRYGFSFFDIKKKFLEGLSTHYQIGKNYNYQNNYMYLGLDNKFIYIVDNNNTVDEVSNLEEFKSYLKTLNVRLIYTSSTEKIESIELPTVKTLGGTTFLSTNTTIQPSFEGSY